MLYKPLLILVVPRCGKQNVTAFGATVNKFWNIMEQQILKSWVVRQNGGIFWGSIAMNRLIEGVLGNEKIGP
jgi:hypothetical protein